MSDKKENNAKPKKQSAKENTAKKAKVEQEVTPETEFPTVELIDDENALITLTDDQGNKVDFYEIAVVEFEEDLYAIFQIAEPVEGIEDDEAIIFKIVPNDDSEEDTFEPVLDETVLESVFNEYLRAAASLDDECDCGEHHHHCDCDCDDCHHDDDK